MVHWTVDYALSGVTLRESAVSDSLFIVLVVVTVDCYRVAVFAQGDIDVEDRAVVVDLQNERVTSLTDWRDVTS